MFNQGKISLSVADPDLELRGGGGGGVLIFLPWWFFSLQSFRLFLPKIGGGGGPGLCPRSATVSIKVICPAVTVF